MPFRPNLVKSWVADLPFPSNEALLLQAMGVLEGLMHNAMRDWNDDLLNR